MHTYKLVIRILNYTCFKLANQIRVQFARQFLFTIKYKLSRIQRHPNPNFGGRNGL
jgi:hypothetical protein